MQSRDKDQLNVIAMRVTVTLLAVIIGPLILAIYYKISFAGLPSPDAMDFGQIARNIANGRGFSTSVIAPLAVSLSKSSLSAGVPDVTHAPLFPFLSALLFVALGAKDAVLALSSGIWFLATIPMLYLLGLRMFDKRTAVFAVALYLICEQILKYSISGLPVTLAIFLFSCLMLCLYTVKAQRESLQARRLLKYCLLTGAVCGFLYLTDYIYFALVPITMLALIFTLQKKKTIAVCAFILGFLLVSGPWMVRNLRMTGHPVFAAKAYEMTMYTRMYPAYSLYRDTEVRPWTSVVLNNVPDIAKKVIDGTAEAVTMLPRVPSTWIAMFFLVALFYRFKKQEVNLVRNLVYWMIAAIMMTASAFKIYPEALMLFTPFIIVVTAGFVFSLSTSDETKVWALKAAPVFLVLMMGFPLANNLLAHKQGSSSQLADFLSREIGREVPSNTLIVSDVPWEVAWYANRSSIWLPKNVSFVSGRQNRENTNLILLTSALLSYPRDEKVDDWKRMFVTGNPGVKGFALMTDPRAPMRVFGRISAFNGQSGRKRS